MGLRGLWVCGSVGLGVCGSGGSVGLRGLWDLWGARRKETETKKEAKERKRRAQASKERLGGTPKFPVRPQVQFFLGAVRGKLFRTILREKSGNGEHRPQKSVQEIQFFC